MEGTKLLPKTRVHEDRHTWIPLQSMYDKRVPSRIEPVPLQAMRPKMPTIPPY
ncbi:hypothetical protein L9F63_003739 [Diploptera punctata]|uniref:Uncharacterized protein n=1 Tax=Diploptera punctata TaxID=6984 RepID=A0AAD7ZJJ2_DIPPU|nr:hypothetical protein L9F63_003739 [Diploptera punctata]